VERNYFGFFALDWTHVHCARVPRFCCELHFARSYALLCFTRAIPQIFLQGLQEMNECSLLKWCSFLRIWPPSCRPLRAVGWQVPESRSRDPQQCWWLHEVFSQQLIPDSARLCIGGRGGGTPGPALLKKLCFPDPEPLDLKIGTPPPIVLINWEWKWIFTPAKIVGFCHSPTHHFGIAPWPPLTLDVGTFISEDAYGVEWAV
jgi:hypothetical protein